jgi:hypothetical protein
MGRPWVSAQGKLRGNREENENPVFHAAIVSSPKLKSVRNL